MMQNKFINKLKDKYTKTKDRVTSPQFKMQAKNKSKRVTLIIARTLLLFGLSFAILFPTIQQISMALRPNSDVNNPMVVWIPSKLSFENIKIAALTLNYKKALVSTFQLSFISMIFQLFSTALAGYALSRLRFKGSNYIFALVLLTIIVPPQALSVYQYLYFVKLGLVGKQTSIYLLNALGMGIRSGIFIFIFRNFFIGLPRELEESAQIDGAGVFRTFWNVMLPNARGAIVTVSLFAFVWQWNDGYFVKLFAVSTSEFPLLTMRLKNIADNVYNALAITGTLNLIGEDVWSNPMFMALIANVSALLMMLPLMIMYLFVQKSFVESIERTGIVG